MAAALLGAAIQTGARELKTGGSWAARRGRLDANPLLPEDDAISAVISTPAVLTDRSIAHV